MFGLFNLFRLILPMFLKYVEIITYIKGILYSYLIINGQQVHVSTRNIYIYVSCMYVSCMYICIFRRNIETWHIQYRC